MSTQLSAAQVKVFKCAAMPDKYLPLNLRPYVQVSAPWQQRCVFWWRYVSGTAKPGRHFGQQHLYCEG